MHPETMADSSVWMTTKISVEERDRVLSLTPKEREAELSAWLKQTKGSHSMKMDIATGFNMLELYGVTIVRHILSGKETSSKPFGSSGFCSFNTITYAMCNLTHSSRVVSERLYEGYTRHIENYLVEDVLPYLEDKRDYVLLKEFSDVWNNHKVLTNWMYKLFMQIDRAHVGLHKGKKSITSCALYCFYNVVFLEVRERVRACVLHYVSVERAGGTIQRDQLKSCVNMFELMGMAANVADVKSIAEASLLPTDISIYRLDLERPLLEDTAEYYSRQRVQWLGEGDMLAYYALVERTLRAEEQRVQHYLNPSTLPHLLAVTLQQLMLVPADRVKESFEGMLRSADGVIQLDSAVFPDDYCAHLRTLFGILLHIQQLPVAASSAAAVTAGGQADRVAGVPGAVDCNDDLMNSFVSKFNEYLLEWVAKILAVRRQCDAVGAAAAASEDARKPGGGLTGSAKTAADIEFITNSLSFYRRVNTLVVACFQSQAQLKVCLHGALIALMNADLGATAASGSGGGSDSGKPLDPTEMLVVYLDKCLRKDNKEQGAASDAQMDGVLTDSVHLFKSIRDKDVFIEHYQNSLGRRLLNNKSASVEEEKNLIGKLKLAQGANFTGRVEGMLVDMSTSEVANKDFHAHTKDVYKEFSAQVLSGNWKLPSADSSRVLLPPVMKQWLSVYEDFYLSTRPKMVLSWRVKVGEATVKFTDGKRAFELVMLPLQAVVLLLFDGRERGEQAALSFGEVAERTGVTEVEVLKRVLHAFSCPNKLVKTPLLCKFPNESKHVSETDRFAVNPAFASKLRRVVVPIGSLEVEMSNSRSVGAAVEQSRKFVLEACLVRIMKARKLLQHLDLVAEVLRQTTSFVPQLKTVKAAIESLIEREYLERDGNSYKYLA